MILARLFLLLCRFAVYIRLLLVACLFPLLFLYALSFLVGLGCIAFLVLCLVFQNICLAFVGLRGILFRLLVFVLSFGRIEMYRRFF